MATKVMMEALSPTMEEGRLVKWLKNEGDQVKAGDTLAEVETDKAIMELVARGDGVLRKRLIEENTSTPVGQLIGVIAASDENIDALVAPASAGVTAAAPAPAAAAAAAPNAPAPNASAPNAPAAPEKLVAEQREQPGASPVPQGAAQAQGEASTPPQEKVAGAGAAPRTPMPHADAHASEQAPHAADNGGRVISSPLARRMAAERGLELEQVRGSGPGGRIVKRDIEAAAAAPPAKVAAEQPAAPEAAAPAAAVPAPAVSGGYRDIPLTQIRKTIARRLSESIGPVPTFYLTAEFDMARAAELRTQLAAMGDEYKVSFNDIVLKAVAVALSMHPEVNAHWLGDKIRQFDRVHLGMAVAIEEGLITPVIFDADRKRMGQISREAKELAGRARERKLKPEEYTGSTFSVSNLGMFGIDQFTAIINPPEAGIVAIGAIEDKPVVVNGEVKVAKRMRVTMSCDHRVIDGALGAKFLQTLRKLVESPLSML